MPYKVVDSLWLKTEADRVEAIILLPMYWHYEWTMDLIREKLANNQKLVYTVQEMSQIGLELVARGIIEEV